MDPSRLRENDILHRDYRLLDRLGAGSFGAVYAAQHTPSELLVAVKVVRDEDCEMRRRKGRSMPREYAALRRLEGHPGILRAHHYFHDSGMFFMVMEPHGTRWTKVNGGYTVQEYILHGDGRPGDLGAAMRARALPGCEKSVFRIFSQIASAVAHMHANGIAHRDLKPENILIDGQYQIKLADFGLATFIDDSGRYDHYSVGTGYYMPPEVAKPSRRYRMFPADIFALGMILWELVQLPGGPRVYEAAFPVVSLQITHPSGLWPSDDRWHACRRVFRSCGRQKADRRPTAHDVLRSRWFVLHRTAEAGSA